MVRIRRLATATVEGESVNARPLGTSVDTCNEDVDVRARRIHGQLYGNHDKIHECLSDAGGANQHRQPGVV